MKLKLHVVIPIGYYSRLEQYPKRIKGLFERLELARKIAVKRFSDFEIVFHVGVVNPSTNPSTHPKWEKVDHEIILGLPKRYWNTYQNSSLTRESLMYMLLDEGILDGEDDYITFIDDDDYISKDYFKNFRKDFRPEYEAIYRTDATEVDLYYQQERLLRVDDHNGTLSSLYQNFTELKTTFQIWGNFFPMKAIKNMFEDLKKFKFKGLWEDLVYWSYMVSNYTYPIVPTSGMYYYIARTECDSLSQTNFYGWVGSISKIETMLGNINLAKKIIAKNKENNFDLGWLELQAYLITLDATNHILKWTDKTTVPAFFTDFEKAVGLLNSLDVTEKLQKGWTKKFFTSTRMTYGFDIRVSKLFNDKIGLDEKVYPLTKSLLDDVKDVLEITI